MQSISADARVFCKMDAVHGYFQLALDESSSLITTFLLARNYAHKNNLFAVLTKYTFKKEKHFMISIFSFFNEFGNIFSFYTE